MKKILNTTNRLMTGICRPRQLFAVWLPARLARRWLVPCCLMWCGQVFCAHSQTTSPETQLPAPESAFSPIFNGVDLTGWEGDPAVWSVQEGALNGRLDRVPPGDRCLVWKGGALGDFEVRFDCWQPGDQKIASGQNGLRFRGWLTENHAITDCLGYDVDILETPRFHVLLMDVMAVGKHRILALPGFCTTAREVDGTNKLEVLSKVAVKPEELEAGFQSGDWNQVSVLAQSNHIQVRINGHVMNDCTDESEGHWHGSGLLALKLWMNKGPVVTARFKNLRLRRLAQGEIIPAPAMQPASAPAAKAQPTAAERLKRVKELYDQGLINKGDYDKKVKEIMDSL